MTLGIDPDGVIRGTPLGAVCGDVAAAAAAIATLVGDSGAVGDGVSEQRTRLRRASAHSPAGRDRGDGICRARIRFERQRWSDSDTGRRVAAMRLLVLHSQLGTLRGGGENFSRNLFASFAALGHDVRAAFAADSFGRYPFPLPTGIEAMPIRGWWSDTLGQATLSAVGRRLTGRRSLRRKWDRVQNAVAWRDLLLEQLAVPATDHPAARAHDPRRRCRLRAQQSLSGE